MKHLGRYKIIAELGRGELGVVYRATDARRKRRPIALKVLRSDRPLDSQAEQRLQQAAELAAILKHPNLVAVYTTGVKQGQRYIAMELVDGRSLAAILASSGPLPLERVVPIVRQLADALDYVHTAGVVHGDLKPSNILIGRDDHVTLTDLGLARAAGLGGATVSAPPYQAPELLDPVSPAAGDARSDIYALGAVTYELLAGRPPRTGQEPAAGGGSLPVQMAGVVDKALAKEADRRYATAGAFSADLSALVGRSAPVEAAAVADTVTPVDAAVVEDKSVPGDTAAIGDTIAPGESAERPDIPAIADMPEVLTPTGGQSEPPGMPESAPEALMGWGGYTVPRWVWATGAVAAALVVTGLILLVIALARPAEPVPVAEQAPAVPETVISSAPGDSATPEEIVATATPTPSPVPTETVPVVIVPRTGTATGVPAATSTATAPVVIVPRTGTATGVPAATSTATAPVVIVPRTGTATGVPAATSTATAPVVIGPRTSTATGVPAATVAVTASVVVVPRTPEATGAPAPSPEVTETMRTADVATTAATATSAATTTALPEASDTPQVTATPGAGDTRAFAPSGAPMVYVPAGESQMGSADTDKSAQSDEKPLHAVYLEAFWIDQVPVTNAQYAACLNAGQCAPLSNQGSETRATYFGDSAFDNYPVVFVPWDAARAYCAWAGKRLPTEAEWERAARGTDGRIYPWGDPFEAQRLNSAEGGPKDTTAVGSYPSGASPYGVLDLAGNVWEWVADWYDAKYYAGSPRDNPAGPVVGQYRVVRGGSWYDNQSGVRSANRSSPGPTTVTGNIGFRCARAP